MCAQPPEYVTDMLSEASLKRTGHFDPAKVQRLTAKCRQQDGRLVSERENMALVAILSTQLLDHQFIQNFPAFPKAPMNHTVSIQHADH